MNLLLDSNVFVFVVQQPDRLPQRARDAIVSPANTRYLSLVTPWELQIKAGLGRLQFKKPIREIVQHELDTGTIRLLPITLDHINRCRICRTITETRLTACSSRRRCTKG